MLRFEWNALRRGDRVLVHDPRTAEMALLDGVVTGVDTHKGANGVGIRVGGRDQTVIWPSHLVVHPNPRDVSEACWRCQEIAEREAPPRRAPAITPGIEASGSPRPPPVLTVAVPR